jgi:hypothetical protein
MSRSGPMHPPGPVHKPSLLRGFFPGLQIASAVLVLVCAQSCLVPQSVDPILVSPHPAPHFVEQSIPPYLVAPILQLVRQGSQDLNCHCVIEIPALPIEEDDPTVDLEARWFVDYAAVGSHAIARRDVLQGTFNDATAILRTLNKFDFNADDYGIVSNGVHVLSVVVGESAGFDDSATSLLPNRSMKTGYTSAQEQFTINVDVALDRPHCPQQLPSLQVCQ